MIELPVSETNGIKGIYTGIYKVTDNDDYNDLPSRFQIGKGRKNIY